LQAEELVCVGHAKVLFVCWFFILSFFLTEISTIAAFLGLLVTDSGMKSCRLEVIYYQVTQKLKRGNNPLITK